MKRVEDADGSGSRHLRKGYLTLHLGGSGGVRQAERPVHLPQCQERPKGAGADVGGFEGFARGPRHYREGQSDHWVWRDVSGLEAPTVVGLSEEDV